VAGASMRLDPWRLAPRAPTRPRRAGGCPALLSMSRGSGRRLSSSRAPAKRVLRARAAALEALQWLFEATRPAHWRLTGRGPPRPPTHLRREGVGAARPGASRLSNGLNVGWAADAAPPMGSVRCPHPRNTRRHAWPQAYTASAMALPGRLQLAS